MQLLSANENSIPLSRIVITLRYPIHFEAEGLYAIPLGRAGGEHVGIAIFVFKVCLAARIGFVGCSPAGMERPFRQCDARKNVGNLRTRHRLSAERLGRGGGDRTHDLRLKRPLLYH